MLPELEGCDGFGALELLPGCDRAGADEVGCVPNEGKIFFIVALAGDMKLETVCLSDGSQMRDCARV